MYDGRRVSCFLSQGELITRESFERAPSPPKIGLGSKSRTRRSWAYACGASSTRAKVAFSNAHRRVTLLRRTAAEAQVQSPLASIRPYQVTVTDGGSVPVVVFARTKTGRPTVERPSRTPITIRFVVPMRITMLAKNDLAVYSAYNGFVKYFFLEKPIKTTSSWSLKYRRLIISVGI